MSAAAACGGMAHRFDILTAPGHGTALLARVDEVSRRLLESQLARACAIVDSMRAGVHRLTE